MKIISGILKGRVIKGYDILGTRPTMDRVKESIFGMIQNYLNEAIVLDLFAGTGNYGIEALSNGAKYTYFNDFNKKCIKLIQNNLTDFNLLDKSSWTNMDYMEALKYFKKQNIKFDLVFLDPPYKELINSKILNYLVDNQLLNDKALVICETLEKSPCQVMHIELFKERSYGDKRVYIYKFQKEITNI